MAPAAPSSTLQAPAANTSKRDFLIELEGAAQKRWKAEKVFETNSPYTDGTEPVPTEDFTAAAAVVRQTHPKWFGTFPYPVSRRFSPRARKTRFRQDGGSSEPAWELVRGAWGRWGRRTTLTLTFPPLSCSHNLVLRRDINPGTHSYVSPVHERIAPPRTRVHHFQNRVRSRLRAHAGEARPLACWISLRECHLPRAAAIE